MQIFSVLIIHFALTYLFAEIFSQMHFDNLSFAEK